jgi:hypothetical protein
LTILKFSITSMPWTYSEIFLAGIGLIDFTQNLFDDQT